VFVIPFLISINSEIKRVYYTTSFSIKTFIPFPWHNGRYCHVKIGVF